MRISQKSTQSVRPLLRGLEIGDTVSFPVNRIRVVRSTATELAETMSKRYSVKKDTKNPDVCWVERLG